MVAPVDSPGAQAKPDAPPKPAPGTDTTHPTTTTPPAEQVTSTHAASTSLFSDATGYLMHEATTGISALQNEYYSIFGGGNQGTGAAATDDAQTNFTKVATTVGDVGNLTAKDAAPQETSAQTKADKDFAQLAAQAADVKGMHFGSAPDKATVTEKGNKGSNAVTEVEATATTKAGVKVDAVVAKGKDGALTQEMIHAGAVTYKNGADGTQVTDKNFQITRKDGVVTVEDAKDQRRVVFNKDHSYTVLDEKSGVSTTFSDAGATTKLANGSEVTQVKGNALDAATTASQTPNTDGASTRFFQDPEGNMAAIKSDGTMFKYNKKEQTLEISQGDSVVQRDFKTGEVKFYKRDAQGNLEQETPNAANLPKGWQIQPDGSIKIGNESIVAGKNAPTIPGEDPATVHIEHGAKFNTRQSQLVSHSETGGGDTQVQSNGETTVLSGTNTSAPQVTVAQTGQMSEATTGGGPAITYDPQTGTMKVPAGDGGSVTMNGNNGSTVLWDPSFNQNTTIGGDGSVQSGTIGGDGQFSPLFTTDPTGNIGLFDGSTLSNSGQFTDYSGADVTSGWSDDSSSTASSGDGTSGGSSSTYNGDGTDGYANTSGDPTVVAVLPGGIERLSDGNFALPDGTEYGSFDQAMTAEKDESANPKAAQVKEERTEGTAAESKDKSVKRVIAQVGAGAKEGFDALADLEGRGQTPLNPQADKASLTDALASFSTAASDQTLNPEVQLVASHLQTKALAGLAETDMVLTNVAA